MVFYVKDLKEKIIAAIELKFKTLKKNKLHINLSLSEGLYESTVSLCGHCC